MSTIDITQPNSIESYADAQRQIRVMADVIDEIDRAAAKHGRYTSYPDRSISFWQNILGEEYGEATKEVVDITFLEETGAAILPENYRRLYAELVQTAAMALNNLCWLRWKGLVDG